MNTYILLITLSVYNALPSSFLIQEFSTKESCEVALSEAKHFYKTVNNESKCISVAAKLKEEKLKQDLAKTQAENQEWSI